jgi:WD40 repeat protein
LPDGRVISSSDDKTVKVWDIKSGEILTSYDSHSDYVYAIDFMQNGNLVTGSRDGTVQIWDIKSN